MTSFSDIYDMALITINDYRINSLFESDEEAFYLYMRGLLLRSIPKFIGCKKNLEYSIDDEEFLEDLSKKEIDILSDLICITWLESNTNDATQINLHLQGRDQKTFSESQNLKEKASRLDEMREKFRQDVTDYQLDNYEGW